MASERPQTPPATGPAGAAPSRSPLTPEQVRRIEINRLRAKELRAQRDAEARKTAALSSNSIAAGQKRARAALTSSSHVPSTQRDARSTRASSTAVQQGGGESGKGGDTVNGTTFRPLDEIQPARNFTKYVEYDFSKMTDTKGGFLTSEDDPHNKALRLPEDEPDVDGERRPGHMSLKEWERHRLLKQLRQERTGPFEPSISVLKDEKDKVCRECGSLEVDWKWLDVFGVGVCNACKDALPEKYSLLTKTEAREDYMLTDPELRDAELLPHLERPNPHKSTWNNMMLYLRFQVEEYAFKTKWGSAEALDAAYEKREAEKKRRKQDKFKSKLQELKKRTRVEAYRRSRQAEAAGGGNGGNFGDDLSRGGKHTHVWGRPVDNDEGIGVKKCVECGMEVEELEF